MAARFKDVQAERIRLRGLRESDIPHLLAYRIQPEIARYQGWDVDYSLDDATKLVQGTIEAKFGTRGEWYQVGIALADSDELIGDFGVYFESDDTAAIEFGYTLSLDHQGKGLATEALRLLLLLVETTQGIVFAKPLRTCETCHRASSWPGVVSPKLRSAKKMASTKTSGAMLSSATGTPPHLPTKPSKLDRA